ncbi:superoxide dismutase mitochondrial [Apiospora arundinis]
MRPGVHPVRQHRDLRNPGGQNPNHSASIGGSRPGNRPCGNAFGIMVAYALQVYPHGEVCGGNCTNAADQNDKLMAAARDFAEYYPDEKADTTLMAETAMGGLLDTGILVYYSGQSPPPASSVASPTTAAKQEARRRYDYGFWIPSNFDKVDRAVQDTHKGLAWRVANL